MDSISRIKIILIVGGAFFFIVSQYHIWLVPPPADAIHEETVVRTICLWIMTTGSALFFFGGLLIDLSKKEKHLSIEPRILQLDGDVKLISPLLYTIITLGCYFRKVTVNTGKRTLHIYRRLFWALQSHRAIPFNQMSCIRIEHRLFYLRWNAYDIFLITKFGEKVTLGVVRGPKWHPLPNENGFIMKGRQDIAANRIADLFADVLEISVRQRPTSRLSSPADQNFTLQNPAKGTSQSMIICPACGKNITSKRARCVFCGHLVSSPP